MRNKVTTLHKHPPAELAVHPFEGDHNAHLLADEDASSNFSAHARGSAGAEPGRPIHRILVPTDFSECSARAIKRGVALARQSNATLTILHVIDINPPAASTHCGSADDLMRQLWVIGTAELARLKKSLEQTQLQIRMLLVEGLPHEAIVENSSGFDLLIISEPHPKSGWSFFSKHTARRVIEQAKCRVHVVSQDAGLTGRNLPSKAQVAA